jgi:hypothetical protein
MTVSLVRLDSTGALPARVRRHAVVRAEPVTIRTALICDVLIVGKSREVEVTIPETWPCALATSVCKVEAAAAKASTAKSTALAAHHAEENLGIDAAMHAAAPASEHIVRVHKVIATIVASSLPDIC